MIPLGEPLDEAAREWREALVETVRPYAEAKLPLLLSGGVDSGTLLAACLELGHHPKCYAYTLHWPSSPDHGLSDDFIAARRAARSAGCEFEGVRIPRTFERLEEDVREVIDLLRVSRKTSVQCAHPMLHLFRAISAGGAERIIAGTGGVVLDGRSVMVLLAEEGEEAVRELRREKLQDRSNPETATGQMHILGEKLGVTLEEPYSENPSLDVGLSIDLAEMNRGPRGFRQKGIAVRAYPQYWMAPGRYQGATPLQVGGGVREWHEDLLDSPLNPGGAKRVIAIYNRILEEIDVPNLLDAGGV